MSTLGAFEKISIAGGWLVQNIFGGRAMVGTGQISPPLRSGFKDGEYVAPFRIESNETIAYDRAKLREKLSVGAKTFLPSLMKTFQLAASSG